MTIDMTRDQTREEIIYRFACWAAASAARQGSKMRGRSWYKPINKIRGNLKELLSDAKPSPQKFATWHQVVVKKLCDDTGETVGWAAKILNMLTKVEVYLSGLGHPELKDLIHPPIDNGLIDAVVERCHKGYWDDDNETIKRLCSKGKPINSIKKYAQYMEVIKGLQLVANCMQCSLFEVERLWGQEICMPISRFFEASVAVVRLTLRKRSVSSSLG